MKLVSYTHRLGSAVDVESDRGPLLNYVYGGKPKPFVHPLRTPAGHMLSHFEPHDHAWHRGLWFTIKFVNGENFWEEFGEFGTQQVIGVPAVSGDGEGVRIDHRSRWVRPGGAGVVFDEQRSLIVRPMNDSLYAIDFQTELHAAAPLLLDRTPFTTWGGYGGLTFRGTRNWQESVLTLSGGRTDDRPKGLEGTWCDLSGKLDGGPGLRGGIAIMDHPSNPRHPVPWYGATGAGHYFNAALLFHEAMRLEKDQVLSLRYRVLVHDGDLPASDIDAMFVGWGQSAGSGAQ